MAIYHPPTLLNEYMKDKIASIHDTAVPFFPTMPTDLQASTDGFTYSKLMGDDANQRYLFNGAVAIYDRMFRMRRTPFPYIKSEQTLYYFYSINESAVQKLIEMTQNVQDLLDRGDDSAKDLNDWIATLWQSQGSTLIPVVDVITGNTEMHKAVTIRGDQFLLPYFHNIKVYQLQETRDIVNFATARTFAGNKLIIDYDWHKTE
jgi:hypothetical protein